MKESSLPFISRKPFKSSLVEADMIDEYKGAVLQAAKTGDLELVKILA